MSLPNDLRANAESSTFLLVSVFFLGSAATSFSCTLKFIVKDCDPNTQEPDDDEGYEDEYVVSPPC